MPKYVFVVETTISLATVVEAPALREAVGEAKKRGVRLLPGDDTVEWTARHDGENAIEGELVDFHEGNGETFDEVEDAWEAQP